MSEIIADRFKILECIGSGGQGSVFRVRDMWDSVMRAVKVFEDSPDPHGLRMWADLRHPNVVEITEIQLGHHEPFIVMEYIPSLPIYDFAASSGEQYVRKVIRDILSALRIAHHRGICHGDIKPSNILISKDTDGYPGSAKLTDFGLIREIGANQDSFAGSIAYVAPEIIRGFPVDHRSDLYALGATLYELVTGRHVFEGEDLRAIVRGHLDEKPTDPRMYNPSISEGLASLIMRFLEKEPSDRTYDPGYIQSDDSYESIVVEPRRISRKRPEAILNRLWELASQGKGGVALITGDAGIGKTSLVRQFRFELGLNGTSSIYIDCAESPNEMSPLDRLLSVVSSLNGGNESNSFAEKTRSFAKTFLPAEFIHTLKRQEDGVITPIIIDSLDPDSELVEVLRRLIPLVGTESVLLIIALDTPVGSEDDFPFRDMIGLPHVRRILLRRFFEREMEQLVGSVLSTDDIDKELVRTIYRLSGGLPALGVEILRHLINSGYVLKADNLWVAKGLEELDSYYSIPNLIRVSIFPTLAGEKQELIGRIALMESPIPENLVDELIGTDIDNVNEHLDALAESGIIQLTSRGWIIRHSELIYSAQALVSEDKKRWFHEHAARIIDHDFHEDPSWAGNLVQHLVQAGDYTTAVQHALRVGFRLDAEKRYGSASRLLARVVPHLDSVPVKEQIEVLELLGRCYTSIGEMGKAKVQYLRILDSMLLSYIGDDRVVSIRHQFARVLSNIGEIDSAKKQVEIIQNDPVLKKLRPEESLEILAYIGAKQRLWSEAEYYARRCLDLLSDKQNSGDIVCKIENTLGVALLMTGKLTEAEGHIKTSYHLRMENGEVLDAGRCAINLGMLYNNLGQYSDAIEWLNLAEARFRSVGAVAWEAQATDLHANIFGTMGNLKEALEFSERAIRLCRSCGQQRMEALALNRSGLIWKSFGEIGEAKRCLKKSFELASRLGITDIMTNAAINLGNIQIVSGRYEQAEEWYHRAERLARNEENIVNLGKCRVGLAKLHKARGDLSLSENILVEAIKDIEKSGDLRALIYARCHHSELMLETNRPEEAKRVIDTIDLNAGEFPPGDLSTVCRISGRVYDRLDMTEESISAFRDCIDAAEQSGMIEIRARAFLEVGKWLARKGPIPGFRAAERYLTKAKDAFSRIGAGPKVREIELALNQIDELDATGVTVAEKDTRKLASLYRMMSVANRCSESGEVLTQILDLAVHAVGGERGLIILVDGERGDLTVRACTEIDGATIADARRISESIVRRVAGAGVPVFSSDALNDARFTQYDSIKINRISCFICVPLVLQERIVGTIYVDSCNMAHQFTKSDLTFLTAFAHHAAIAMENLRFRERLREENTYLQEQLKTAYSFSTIVGHSPAMENVYRKMGAVAKSPVTVVIQGETGTGKELIARAIHYNSERAKERFVPVNCGALPDSLLESELFGYVKGAFTGAVRSTPGVFVTAHRGTIFLDEITDMSPNLQTRLLRVLEIGEVKPLGQPGTREVDVRVICATNKDLFKEMKAGRFREDLYYRLKVVVIEVPALRERLQDIPLLVAHFIEKYALQFNKEIRRCSDNVISYLCNKNWPGNVRELEHVIEACVALCPGRIIELDTVEMALGSSFMESYATAPSLTLSEAKSAIERSYISRALRETGWNVSAAARLLGINRRQVQRLMKRFDLGTAANFRQSRANQLESQPSQRNR